MKNNKWKTVWNNRQTAPSNPTVLADLLAADGYDHLGKLTDAVWLDYVRLISEKLRLMPGDTLFEVGCGAGAFLYPFYSKGFSVSGIDYSAPLVSMALSAMPDADIRVAEAADMSAETPFDIVVSSGVFLYFPSYAYSKAVLELMLPLASKSIGILDVPDSDKQADALRLRKRQMREAEYARKYEGLDHLYYSRNWFRQVLAGKGMTVRIEDQNIPDYLHSSYRFNVFIDK